MDWHFILCRHHIQTFTKYVKVFIHASQMIDPVEYDPQVFLETLVFSIVYIMVCRERSLW